MYSVGTPVHNQMIQCGLSISAYDRMSKHHKLLFDRATRSEAKPGDRKQRPNRRLYKFWYFVGDKSQEEVKAHFAKLVRETIYMIHHPIEVGVGGVFQTEKPRNRSQCQDEMGMTVKMLTSDEMERMIGEIHRTKPKYKETGTYVRNYRSKLVPDMDPDYFRKYWDEKNNQEGALKIRLKRERENWRPYVYNPETGIVVGNPVEQPVYEVENHTSDVVEEIMSAYLPGQLLESDTEIDE